MSRPVLLALLVVVVLGGAYAARQLIQPPEAGTPGASGAPQAEGDAPAEPPPSPAELARRQRLQERLDGMMPKPEDRPRPGPTPPRLPEPAAEQVRITLARGGDVIYAGDTFSLGATDEAAAAKAATDLRAALQAAHDARGGDDFRDAEGRSKLVLLARSSGDLDPNDLHRLLEVCKQPPLRVVRVEVDLAGR